MGVITAWVENCDDTDGYYDYIYSDPDSWDIFFYVPKEQEIFGDIENRSIEIEVSDGVLKVYIDTTKGSGKEKKSNELLIHFSAPFRGAWPVSSELYAEVGGPAPQNIPTISGFCTIADGKAERLLCGQITGGSMGGDFIKTMYNQETSEHVVMLRGFWGGFGGFASSGVCYSMKNGKMAEIESLRGTTCFHEKGDEVLYEWNGEEVSKEAYDRAIGKYMETADGYYALEEWPW